MANSLNASFRTIWAKEMQQKFWVTNIWKPQANFRLEAELKQGQSIERIYRSATVPQTYTRYNDVSFQNLTNTAETLTVNTTPVIPFIISDLDELQSYPTSRQRYTDDTVEQMNNIINGYYGAQVTNATSTIDASDFGSTAGNGASIVAGNIAKMFALAQKKIGRQNVYKYKPGESQFFANLTPDVYQALLEYLSGKESVLGDRSGDNGYAGQYYNFDLYVSNGTYWTGTCGIATNPTANDTITIKVANQTIVFTFVSAIGSTGGNVLIGGSVATTGANLAALINAPGTTTANGVALTADQQAVLYGCTATYGSNALTLTWQGVGAPVVSSSLTATADGWTTGKNISNLMFGQKGAVDIVIQRNPMIDVDKAENRIVEWKIKPYTLFGMYTFKDGARKLVNVKVDTTSYT